MTQAKSPNISRVCIAVAKGLNWTKDLRVLLIIGAGALPVQASAALNDVFPGDYLAGSAGLTAFSSYIYQRNWKGLYSDGRSDQQREIDQNVAVVLVAHYFDALGRRMLLSASGGVATSELTDLGAGTRVNGSGVFDPKIGWTVWPFLREGARQQLALNFSYIPPWGDYTAGRAINMGQNRARSVASLAWSLDASKALRIEATAESAFFGKNSRFGVTGDTLEQAPAYALTVYGRYLTLGPVDPYMGLQGNWGGETRINGVAREDSVGSSRMMLGLRVGPSTSQILHLRYARDVRVDHGMRLASEFALRWTFLR